MKWRRSVKPTLDLKTAIGDLGLGLCVCEVCVGEAHMRCFICQDTLYTSTEVVRDPWRSRSPLETFRHADLTRCLKVHSRLLDMLAQPKAEA